MTTPSSAQPWRRCLAPSSDGDVSGDASASSSKPYYFNVSSGKSSWKLPKGFSRPEDVPLFTSEDEKLAKEEDLVAVDEVVKIVAAKKESTLASLLLGAFKEVESKTKLPPLWTVCADAVKAFSPSSFGASSTARLHFPLHPILSRGRNFPGLADFEPSMAWRVKALHHNGGSSRGSRGDFDGAGEGQAQDLTLAALWEHGGILSLAGDALEGGEDKDGAGGSLYFENLLTQETSWARPSSVPEGCSGRAYFEPGKECNVWPLLAKASNCVSSRSSGSSSLDVLLAGAQIAPFSTSESLPFFPTVVAHASAAALIEAPDVTSSHLQLLRLLSFVKGLNAVATMDISGHHASREAIPTVVWLASHAFRSEPVSAGEAKEQQPPHLVQDLGCVPQRDPATRLLRFLAGSPCKKLCDELRTYLGAFASSSSSLSLPSQTLLVATEILDVLRPYSFASASSSSTGTEGVEPSCELPSYDRVALAIDGIRIELAGPSLSAAAYAQAAPMLSSCAAERDANTVKLITTHREGSVASLSAIEVDRQRLFNARSWLSVLYRCVSPSYEVGAAATVLTNVVLAILSHRHFHIRGESGSSSASLKLVLNNLSLPCIRLLARLHAVACEGDTRGMTKAASSPVLAAIELWRGELISSASSSGSDAHVILASLSAGLAALVNGGEAVREGDSLTGEDAQVSRIEVVALCTSLLSDASSGSGSGSGSDFYRQWLFSGDLEVVTRVSLQELEDLPASDLLRLDFIRLAQACLGTMREKTAVKTEMLEAAVCCLEAIVEAGRTNTFSPSSSSKANRRLSSSSSSSRSNAADVRFCLPSVVVREASKVLGQLKGKGAEVAC